MYESYLVPIQTDQNSDAGNVVGGCVCCVCVCGTDLPADVVSPSPVARSRRGFHGCAWNGQPSDLSVRRLGGQRPMVDRRRRTATQVTTVV